MRLAGYGPYGNPAFLALMPQLPDYPGIRPRDHHDNFNSGFAFAAFHSGTAPPQMAFAI